jgi:subtilase family serine protease/sugar lactone lactonase YvrE
MITPASAVSATAPVTTVSRSPIRGMQAVLRSFFSARSRTFFAPISLGVTLVLSQSAMAQPPVQSRITQEIDESHRIALAGDVHPLAQARFDRGVAPSSHPMDRMLLLLARSTEQNAALEKLLAEQVDPESANFHAWLTPEEFGERFGPSDADLTRITNWLTSHGFSIGSISSGRTVLEFSGTAGQVQQAFHTEIHQYLVPASSLRQSSAAPEEHWANASNPEIPMALAPVVAGVVSLNDFGLHAMHRTLGPVVRHANSSLVTPQFDVNYNGNVYYGLSPYDFATMYNVTPLWNAGITGTGETIAIVGQTNIKTADIAAFRKAFGLPAMAPTIIVNGTDPATNTGDEEESDLDVEWAGAVAKGATIQYVTSASTSSTAGVFLSAEYIVDKKTATILSMSYGGCELALGTSGNQFVNTLWQQAASEGISVFVAAGDSGSAGCDAHEGNPPFAAEYGLQVNGTASTPYNVAVGGTDLADYNPLGGTNTFSTYWSATNGSTGASLKKYVPEVVWNDSCAIGSEAICNNSSNLNYVRVDGGSGGKSACTTPNSTTDACSGGYAKPAWQSGTGVPADGKRDIPDVSLFAGDGERGSFYLICDSDVAACTYSDSSDAIALAVGGTSASSPAMAGIQALVNQKLKAAQGNVNPTLYAMAKKETLSGCNSTSGSGTACVFNDVTSGTNAMPCYNGTANCKVTTSGDAYAILPGYAAGTGFDLASGLGSINASNLVNQWPGATAAAPVVTLSATSVAFGNETKGIASAAKTVTLTNSGTAALSSVSIALAGVGAADFIESNTCGTSVAAGAKCTITLEFKPASAGSYAASVSIKDNATGSPQTIALTGTGIAAAPAVTLSATSVAFGNETKGIASAAKTVTLTNSGAAALSSVSIALAGAGAADFIESNTCGTSVAAGAKCTITLEFKPASTGSYAASVSIKDNATGSPQTIALTGTGIAAAPAVTLSATSVAFGNQAKGTTSVAKTITLKNTGTAALSSIAITLAGSAPADFAESNNCGASLAVSASCTLTLTFKPAAAAAYTATVDIKDNAAGSPQTIALSGTGYTPAPKATLSATSVAFGEEAVATVSAAKTVTLTNTGTAILSGISISLTGTNPTDFTETNKCAATLAVNASCIITLTFKPAAAVAYTATVDIKDNAAGSPQTIALSGTGYTPAPKATLSATSVAFGEEAVATVSDAKTVTFTNTGTATLSGISISLTGTNPTDFTETNKCAATLAVNASCVITLTFKPAAAVAYKATVDVKDNAAGSPQAIALSGTGYTPAPAVTLSATSEAFGNQTVGTTSSAKTVTLTNSGTAALTSLSVSLAGANPTDFAETTSCGTTLAAKAACTITLAFKPAAASAFTAAVDVKDNASGSPQTIALSGTGIKSTLTGTIIDYAGSGVAGYSGNNGAATKADFYYAEGIVSDANGNLYIADEGNNVIRKVNVTTGIITTVAGNGYGAGMVPGGYTGDGGPALQAELGGPFDVAVDKAGNIYIADTYNSAIRKVTAATGIITTIAGDGTYGYSGDGGPATQAEISWPKSIALDSAGNLYISDSTNQVIRKVTASTGKISTIAGGGNGCAKETDVYGDGCPAVDANFEVPGYGTGTAGIAVDSKGNIYIADPDVETVRKITAATGIITVVAGNGVDGFSGDGGLAVQAELNNPHDVKVDGAGNIFIADLNNNVIREVAAATGRISTIAGIYYSSGGGKELSPETAATAVKFSKPTYISIDPSGNLFISDVGDFMVDKVYGAATPVPLNY